MRYLILAFAMAFFGCGRMSPTTPQQRFDEAKNELRNAQSEEERFYALNDAAKEGFVLGKTDEARSHAEELLNLLPKYKDNWNYGNAVQDANLVLGRIAVLEGQLDDAKQFLIKAGQSPGSPQMDTFGPNMSLAKDLLEKGETDVVLQYFDLCRKFWEMDNGNLDHWTRDVRAGKIPDFGANLVY
jgi:tetratricopeptide (TPR) repeat protein